MKNKDLVIARFLIAIHSTVFAIVFTQSILLILSIGIIGFYANLSGSPTRSGLVTDPEMPLLYGFVCWTPAFLIHATIHSFYEGAWWKERIRQSTNAQPLLHS
ncbi:MAG: hypothetical protein SF123_19980 [Chloroflexota bacterium]|nr:hypothetical protein [Chloroflexota bacterium]